MPKVTATNVLDVLVKHASRKSCLHTDECRLYRAVNAEFSKHEAVRHSGNKYARGYVHNNTIEGFFGLFMHGTVGNTTNAATSTSSSIWMSSHSDIAIA